MHHQGGQLMLDLSIRVVGPATAIAAAVLTQLAAAATGNL
jgi:hypothetical protein